MYNLDMAKFLLIGKDIPENYDFAKGILGSNNDVFCAESEADTQPDDYNDRIFTTSWNKSSAISTHSFLIKAETKFDQIENVIFYFDADFLSTKFIDKHSDKIATAVDTMITPFLYMTDELLKRADQKKNRLCVSFIVKDHKNEQNSGIVKIALAAFCQLAENFAQNVAEREYLRVCLAKSSAVTETVANEQQLGEWTAKSMIELSDKKQTVKNASSWNKAGAKVGSSFPFFK